MNASVEELQKKQAELEAQLAEARRAAREAEYAEERARRQAAADARRDNARKANAVYGDGLIAALKAVGFDTANYTFERNEYHSMNTLPLVRLNNDGKYEPISIQFDSFGPKLTIKISKGCEHVATFPLRSDGTFNYEKIAQRIVDLHIAIDNENARRQRAQNVERNNRAIAKRVREKFGVDEWSGLVSVAPVHTPDRVLVSIKKSLTEEEAIRLINLLNDNGFTVK